MLGFVTTICMCFRYDLFVLQFEEETIVFIKMVKKLFRRNVEHFFGLFVILMNKISFSSHSLILTQHFLY